MDMNAERCAEFAGQAEKETDIPVQRDGNFPMCTQCQCVPGTAEDL